MRVYNRKVEKTTMSKNRLRIAAATIALIAAVVIYMHASRTDAQNLIPEGSMPYTPTRAEWLAVNLNGAQATHGIRDSGFTLHFIADKRLEHQNTIIIFCSYAPERVNRTFMNLSIQVARQAIMQHAESYGWDSWVKIRENIQLLK